MTGIGVVKIFDLFLLLLFFFLAGVKGVWVFVREERAVIRLLT